MLMNDHQIMKKSSFEFRVTPNPNFMLDVEFDNSLISIVLVQEVLPQMMMILKKTLTTHR